MGVASGARDFRWAWLSNSTKRDVAHPLFMYYLNEIHRSLNDIHTGNETIIGTLEEYIRRGVAGVDHYSQSQLRVQSSLNEEEHRPLLESSPCLLLVHTS